jgi:dipeptidyl aminopeptidase/acylaminoacyl peptidase
VEAASGKRTNLTAHEGKVVNIATSVSPDGKTLLITSNQKGGYQNVALLDVATKNLKWVTDTHWEAGSGDFSPSGETFTYTINGDGIIDAYLVDAGTMQSRKLPLKTGLNGFAAYPSSYAPSGHRLLVSHESSVEPPTYLVYDTTSGKTSQMTQSATASLNASALPESQIVHYKTFDGKTISALMWVPFNLKRDRSNPALVLPHGGPTSQMVDY